MKHLSIALFVVVFAVVQANAAQTTTAVHKKTASVNVVGSVATTCTLTTPSFQFNIGIAAIHAPGSAILKQGMLGVRCTKGASAQIGVNNGLNGSAAGAQYGTRSMKDSGGDYLGYDLCHDNACAAKWTSSYTYLSPNDKGTSLPVWTRITTGQTHAKLGSYSDSVTVTISF
jgi:spore coat protein U-like protein